MPNNSKDCYEKPIMIHNDSTQINLFSRRLFFFKLKKKITSVSSIINVDSICQHNTPFVIDIAITFLSVPRDYIPPPNNSKDCYEKPIMIHNNSTQISHGYICTSLANHSKYVFTIRLVELSNIFV
jgi:hypothetical protein